jgi:hypothetical protein
MAILVGLLQSLMILIIFELTQFLCPLPILHSAFLEFLPKTLPASPFALVSDGTTQDKILQKDWPKMDSIPQPNSLPCPSQLWSRLDPPEANGAKLRKCRVCRKGLNPAQWT